MVHRLALTFLFFTGILITISIALAFFDEFNHGEQYKKASSTIKRYMKTLFIMAFILVIIFCTIDVMTIIWLS